jgi:hypothetical protein
MKNDRNFGCALPSPSEQKLLMTSILRHQVYVIMREVSLENSWRDSMSHFYAFLMPTVDIRTYRNNKQATTNHTIVISSHNNNRNNNNKIIQIIKPPESHYYRRRRRRHHHLQYRHLKMSWPSCLAYRVFSNPSLIKVGRVVIAICAER